MKKKITVILSVLFACVLALSFAGCKGQLVPPAITGPSEMEVYEGYGATSSEEFTVTGDSVTVTKTAGDKKIAWNNETKRLDISAGLSVGEYPVTLTASNGKQSDTADFTLKVLTFVLPSITGEDTVLLEEDYAETTVACTVAGTNVSVTVTEDGTNGYVEWLSATNELKIKEGLEEGEYIVELTASNGNEVQNAVLSVSITVTSKAAIKGPQEYTLPVDYEAAKVTGFTFTGTVEKTSGEDKIKWNNTDKAIEIEAGLAVGDYPVTLTATKENSQPFTFTFTLHVVQTYAVTGNFEYTSGTLTGGTYTVEDDEITVTAGNFKGTADASAGSFSIALPAGVHDIVLTSKYFRDAKVQVTVDNAATEAEEAAVFTVPKLEAEAGVTYTDEGFKLAAQAYSLFAGEPTAASGTDFVVTYTTAGGGADWFNRGGIYFTVGGEENSKFFSLATRNNSTSNLIGFRDASWDYLTITEGVPTLNEELTITLAYSSAEHTYYVYIHGYAVYKIDSPTDLRTMGTGNITDALFADGARKLGIGYMSAHFENTYSNVYYGIGEEALEKALNEMKVSFTAEEAAEQGTVKLYATGNCYSDETEIHSGDKVFIGSDVRVAIQTIGAYAIKDITVNDTSVYASLDGTELTLEDVKADTAISVTFEEVETYTVRGTYEYKSGTFAEGAYKNDTDVITVKSGTFSNTVETHDGNWEIDLPEGEHDITVESKMFRGTTIENVNVTTAGTTVSEKVEFSVPKFASENGITYTDGGYQFGGNANSLFAGNPMTEEGFVFEYTVKGSTAGSWYKTGGLLMKNTTAAGGERDSIFVFSWSKNPHTGGGNNANVFFVDGTHTDGNQYFTDFLYDAPNDTLKVKIVYYDGAFYIFLNDNAYLTRIDKNSVAGFTGSNAAINKENFFKDKTRYLGLINFENQTSLVTFSDIHYGLGDAAAQAELDKLKVSFTVDQIDGGEGSAKVYATGKLYAGETEITDGKVFSGSDVRVEVTPGAEYAVEDITVNGTSGKDDMSGSSLTIENVTETTTVHVTFKQVQKYTVSGKYTYASGTLVSGEYKNDTDVITVKSGTFSNTVETHDGTWSIALPEGTHDITVESAMFRGTTLQNINVQADSGATVSDPVKFTVPKLASESGVTYNDDGFTLGKSVSSLFAGEPTAASGTGFVISFTATKGTSGWFIYGGFYLTQDTTNVWITTALKGDGKCWLGVKAPNSWGYVNNGMNEHKESSPLSMTFIYDPTDNAYYAKVGSDAPIKITFSGSTTFDHSYVAETFYQPAVRKLGMGYAGSELDITYTNVYYGIGEEAVNKALDEMKVQVNLDQIDGGEGSAQLHVSGNCYANETEIHSGDKVFIGSSVRVDVTPGAEYAVEDITVNGTSKKDDMSGSSLTIENVTETTTVHVTFKQVQKYTVSGKYTYSSGTLQGGVYKNDGDTVTVTSGTFSGTGSDGTWSIELPEGEHEITVESAMFRGVKVSGVTVTTDGATVQEPVEFKVPKLAYEVGVTYTDDGFKLPVHGLSLFAGNPTAKSGTGFVITYTTAGAGADWFNRGGIYFTVGADRYHFSLASRTNETSNLIGFASYDTFGYKQFDGVDMNAEMTITLVYAASENAYYVKIHEYANTFKFTTNADLNVNGASIVNSILKSGDRKLGIGYKKSAFENTYKNVYYGIGEEAVNKALDEMKVQVNLDQIDGGEGSAQLHVSGNCYANETEIHSGDKVFIGSSVRVDVTPGAEYAVEDITVNGTSGKGDMSGSSLTVTVTELTTFHVTLKQE